MHNTQQEKLQKSHNNSNINTVDEKKDNNILLQCYQKEWEVTNQYLNDIDKGYSQSITLFLSVLTLPVAAFKAFGKEIEAKDLEFFWFILPIIFLVCFGFLSYQFRITAILRGHLARVEYEMNKIIGKDVFMWNSTLTETYMCNNNVPNKFLMLPVIVFIVCYSGYLVYETLKFFDLWFFFIYWAVIFVVGVIETIPFFRNDTIRWETYNHEMVTSMYLQYLLKKHKYIKKVDIDWDVKNDGTMNVVVHYKKNRKYKISKENLEKQLKIIYLKVLPNIDTKNIEFVFVNTGIEKNDEDNQIDKNTKIKPHCLLQKKYVKVSTRFNLHIDKIKSYLRI